MPTRLTQAIVRPPGKLFAAGLTTARLGTPDLHLALEQHRAYVAALEDLGLEIHTLPASDSQPDSCFVEDTAVLTPRGAIITRPGEPDRRLEVKAVQRVLGEHIERIRTIVAPGTVDGGDVLDIGGHYFIGTSNRTDPDGAQQLAALLQRMGYGASFIPVRDGLHLKSSVSALEAGRIVVTHDMATRTEFMKYDRIVVPEEEAFAANCLWINGQVLIAAGFEETRDRIADAGYGVIELDLSEFEKQDGGPSCLSLRW